MYNTIHTWDSELSADSVEWCTCEGYENLLAVGTYQVEKSESAEVFSSEQRHGRITLHNVNESNVLLQTLNVAAVLDMKWSPQPICCSNDQSENIPILAVVDAKGISLFKCIV
jgi:diphthamide biosynthesis protein 7